MPTFQYKAKTQAGEAVSGSLTAGDRRLALAQLGRLGYYPLLVDEGGVGRQPGSAPAAAVAWRDRMTNRDVLMFTQQLCSLLRSGMQLNEAMGTLAKRAQKKGTQAVLQQVRADIIEGTSLSDALARFPKLFSRLYVNLIRAGEASGTLDQILERIARHFEQMAEVRERVVSAMIYPLIIVLVGLGTITFFMTFMVPRFAQMFKEMGRTMPLPTRILIGVSDLFVHFWWVPPVLVAGAVVAYRRRILTPAGRRQIDGWKLQLPVAGPVILLSSFTHFARTLATLLENGVPVLNALQIVEDTMTNQVIAHEIHEARTRVTDGTSISQPLAKGKIFPPLLLDMLAVGEASGGVVPSLKNIADTYDRELAHRLRIYLTILEPAIIIAIGVVVGAIVVSVLMAVFDITSGIGK